MGTPDFAVESLRALLDKGCNVVAVVTVPDKPAGRGLKMRHSAVKEFALDRGLKLLQPEKLRDPLFLNELQALEPDLAIVVAFRMLPEVVWSLPRLGTFNLHGSLLPKYRGAAPINWAIINGDKTTGVTTFMLNHEIDCGDIIRRQTVDILPNDTAGVLHDKMMLVGAHLVVETVQDIAAGNINPLPQNETDACPAPKIFKQDCEIDWMQPLDNIFNKIRGLSPYPAAWCKFGDTTAKILDVTKITQAHSKPIGEMHIGDNQSIMVTVDGGFIQIIKLHVAGKKAMNSADYLKGNTLPQ